MLLSLIIFFEKYLIYSVKTENGRADYYYYDEITWIVSLSAVFWIMWLLIKRINNSRKYKRKTPRQKKQKNELKKAILLKDELSKKYLARGISENICAIGIGQTNGIYCIQVFINDFGENLFSDLSNERLPNQYKGFSILIIKIPQASFIGLNEKIEEKKELIFREDGRYITTGKLPAPIRELQKTIIGGVSGANTNLKGQSGTIGYFCKKKSILPRKSKTYLLSNTHVFADLKKTAIDESDLIVQPSPGEPSRGQPIGQLEKYSKIELENDHNNANYVDAAIAKLWDSQKSENLIPMIGRVIGIVKQEDIIIGEYSRKFGRTTGYTVGNVLSIYLDIWIKYDRTGQKALFSNQILIEPNSDFEMFVDKGDSGSLVVDAENYATGLIFAGANGRYQNDKVENSENKQRIDKSIKNYGVANPISNVLNELKVEFIGMDE